MNQINDLPKGKRMNLITADKLTHSYIQNVFAPIPATVYTTQKISQRDLYVFGFIATRHPKEKFDKESLAKDLGVSLDTVKRAVTELQKVGLLWIERLPNNKFNYHVQSGEFLPPLLAEAMGLRTKSGTREHDPKGNEFNRRAQRNLAKKYGLEFPLDYTEVVAKIPLSEKQQSFLENLLPEVNKRYLKSYEAQKRGLSV